MERSKLLTQALAVTILVSGCSYFSEEEPNVMPPEIMAEVVADLDGMDGDENIDANRAVLDTEVATIYAEEQEGGEYRIWRKSSTGPQPDPMPLEQVRKLELSPAIVQSSVQVFSITDTPSPAASPMQARKYTSTRFASSDGEIHVNPSVSVYPLDEAMAGTFDGKRMPTTTISTSVAPMKEAAAPMEKQHVFTNVVPVASTTSEDLEVIYFAHNTSAIAAGQMEKIDHIVNVYNANPAATVSVLGHANLVSSISEPVSRQIANLKTSMNRAFSVARVLMKKGVPTEKIRTSGYGEGHLSNSRDGLDAQAASRRVEVSIDK